MNRKELFDLVKSMKENEFIFREEAEAFKEVITKADNEDLEEIHESILEAAESTSAFREDFQKIAELIYPTFNTEQEPADFMNKNSNFHALDLEGYDIFSIYDRKSMYGVYQDEFESHRVYHIIVKVNYEGETYGFGYNEAQGALSYSMDGSKPYFDRVPDFGDYGKKIDFIRTSIEYTIGVI